MFLLKITYKKPVVLGMNTCSLIKILAQKSTLTYSDDGRLSIEGLVNYENENEFGILIQHLRVHFPCGSSDLEWFWPWQCAVHKYFLSLFIHFLKFPS